MSIRLALASLALGLLATLAAPPGGAEELARYSGAQLYERFCAACHGARGEGDGPVAPFFKLAPPDLTRLARRHGGEFPADKVGQIIDGRKSLTPHGSRQMPVWGVEFLAAEGTSPEGRARADALVTRLVEHLRSLQIAR